jgi:hypothetical protein
LKFCFHVEKILFCNFKATNNVAEFHVVIIVNHLFTCTQATLLTSAVAALSSAAL